LGKGKKPAEKTSRKETSAAQYSPEGPDQLRNCEPKGPRVRKKGWEFSTSSEDNPVMASRENSQPPRLWRNQQTGEEASPSVEKREGLRKPTLFQRSTKRARACRGRTRKGHNKAIFYFIAKKKRGHIAKEDKYYQKEKGTFLYY